MVMSLSKNAYTLESIWATQVKQAEFLKDGMAVVAKSTKFLPMDSVMRFGCLRARQLPRAPRHQLLQAASVHANQVCLLVGSAQRLHSARKAIATLVLARS